MVQQSVVIDLVRLVAGFALFVGSGLLIAWGWGLRGRALALAGAPTAFAAVGTLAVAEVALPFPWRPPVVAAGIGLLTGLGLLVRRRRPPMRNRGPFPWWIVAALFGTTLVVGGVLLFACGGTYETVSQTWDATFHTSTVRGIYQIGTAAPNRLGALAYGSEGSGFYPAAFAPVAALIGQSVFTDPVPACNLAAALIGGSVWPSSLAILARTTLGDRRSVIALALFLSLGSWGMPYAPMSFGVLWPTLTAYAVAPLTIAAATAALIPLLDGSRPGMPAVAATVGAVLVLSMGHPRVVLIVALFVVLEIVVVGLVALARAARRGDRGTARWAGWMVAGSIGSVAAAGVASRKVMAEQFQYIDWPIVETPAGIVGRALINSPVVPYPGLLVAALTWLGCLVALRRPRLSWLPVCYLAAILLEAVTATSRNNLVLAVTRFWYADRWRVVPIIAVFSLLLATLATLWLARRLGPPLQRLAARWWHSRPRRFALLLVVAVGYAVAIADLPQRLTRLDDFYIAAAKDPDISLVSPREQQFYRRIAEWVPEGALILNNPQDGSAFIYAYSGRKVTFPSAFFDRGGLTSWLRENLVTASPALVCQRVRSQGVGYVFNGGQTFHTAMFEPTPAPGMQIPEGFWATTPVAADGDLRLYKITGCKDGKPIR